MFMGFSKKSFEFLRNISEHNRDKAWFEQNKKKFNDNVVQDMKALVADLGEFMLTIDPLLEVRPMVNKTISRIHKDVRFSRDGSLYRSNMWITFKRPQENWQDYPAYFFEMFPDGYRYGMGFYKATSKTMSSLREEICDAQDRIEGLVKPLLDFFVIQGEKYKKKPKEDLPEIIREFCWRKSFYLERRCPIDEIVLSEKLADDLVDHFQAAKPFYKFLVDMKLSSTMSH